MKKLPHSDFYFLKLSMDDNGNKTAYFIKNNKQYKVQTNGNMPKTHCISLNQEITDDDLIWMRKELVNYLFNINEI